MTGGSKSFGDAIADRAIVRGYSIIPRWMLKFFPTNSIKRMYDKVMYQAVADYETPAMAGIPVDFDDIATATMRVEAEITKRGLDRKPLNPHEEGPQVYAADVWSKYLR